ncbi:Uncharacterized protein dnm_008210 [Desulfonema magnum]|uniref:Uncharacterized protein n=1 Tax=Desulfonema magnum TaxID=45655 RepID=A0A975BGV5_9BACT|nr:Uncharacterized protein dnm_008210 [Desulfonema magnum]
MLCVSYNATKAQRHKVSRRFFVCLGVLVSWWHSLSVRVFNIALNIIMLCVSYNATKAQRHKVSRRFFVCLGVFVAFAVCPCFLRLKKVAHGVNISMFFILLRYKSQAFSQYFIAQKFGMEMLQNEAESHSAFDFLL